MSHIAIDNFADEKKNADMSAFDNFSIIFYEKPKIMIKWQIQKIIFATKLREQNAIS